MSDQAIVAAADLQKKDKSELQTIVQALGGKATSRAKKADLIDQILVLSGAVVEGPADDAPAAEAANTPAADDSGSAGSDAGDDDAPASDSASSGDASAADAPATDSAASDAGADESDQAPSGGRGRNGGNNRGGADTKGADSKNERPARGRRGRGRNNAEPPAEWETELEETKGSKSDGNRGQNKNDGNRGGQNSGGQNSRNENRNDGGQNSGGQSSGGQNSRNENRNDSGGQNGGGQNSGGQNSGDNRSDADGNDDIEPGNRRRRRRGRSRDRDDEGPGTLEATPVQGFLDLRDDGYGFLRVNGWMQSKEDAYVSVKMVRQHGLRRGDLVTGSARPATRNEKNPAMDTIETINGLSPDEAKSRPHFDELTPLFPEERLRLELTREPLQLTPRIVDLVSPIGKGQRGLIVSPPKAGKTTIMKQIAKSIEKNNPEVHLVVLLIDERPEEVTDMQRSLEHGEVAASTFDRPPEEHCALAELTIERAKRMVESGEDVVIILDGITRLTRAYNMAGPASGRLMSGGLDTAAIYPPKRFLGAARNLEEGGSLTILATALVETGSRMDEVIFEEFKGTGNMELRLDRRLAEKRIFPAIDIDGSSTRHDELIQSAAEKKQSVKLRRVLSGMAENGDGQAAASMELLNDRLKNFKTNEAFLAELAKS